MKAKLLQ